MTAHHFKFYFRASISSDGQKLIYVNTIVKKGNDYSGRIKTLV